MIRVISGSPFEKSAIQVSPSSQVVKTKRRPGASHKADGLRSGRNVRDHFKGFGIKDMHTPRLIVRNGNEPAIIGNCPADGIAGLKNPCNHLLLDDIDLGKTAIASKNEGEPLVGGIDEAGMGEITQSLDAANGCALALVNEQQAALGALDNKPQIAGRDDGICLRERVGRQGGGRDKERGDQDFSLCLSCQQIVGDPDSIGLRH